jgi:2-dehydro-3-deoxyphosphogluconate aldolase / (4S)-4-hydroxy-2-oxoglutarate aldolase
MLALTQILEHKIVAILRGIKPDDVIHVATALYKGGIRLIEVTLNSEDALSGIELLNKSLGDSMMIGAGTVLNKEKARAAIQSGAKFLISPNMDSEVIKITKAHGLISIPGAYTATEVIQAHEYGGDIIKVFPVPNPDYLRSLHAPLNHIRMMAVGGINLDNIKQYKAAGAVAFGIGSSLVEGSAVIDEQYLKQLTEKARDYIQAID